MTNHKEFQNLQDLFFLGPKSEQRKFFQEMIELINNDMIFWRRNFWPKDPPVIPYRNITSDIGKDHLEEFTQSLVLLLSELKMDVPFFSPRYVAHMTGDLSLPGLIGYYAGLLYNSNNVSVEASPITLRYELEVGREFARLFGFDETSSFGHITSGGTVANFESVYYAKNSRFLPATIGLMIKGEDFKWPSFLPTDPWKLLNMELVELPMLLEKLSSFGNSIAVDIMSLLKNYSPSTLGDFTFWTQFRTVFDIDIGTPVLIAPATAHYSWSKASNLFGIGRKNCLSVLVDERLRMSMDDLEAVLEKCEKERRPIIQTIAVLGSTEYGSFDPLDRIVKIMDKWKSKGLYSPIHVDAAYGGYLKAMFIEGPKYGSIAQLMKEKLPELYSIFESVGQVDSITIDPHKLGHTPYGAGVFVTKHGFTKEFISEEADYCLTARGEEMDSFPLGKYILEGSKSGASATSVYFSNKLIPLNSDGYGGFFAELFRITARFHELLLMANEKDDEFAGKFQFVPIINPESNLLCFFVRPINNFQLSVINDLNELLIWHFFPRPTDSIQEFSYFVSKTKLKFTKLVGRRPQALEKINRDTDHLNLVRLVFLNRGIESINGRGETYMDDFISELKKKCLSHL